MKDKTTNGLLGIDLRALCFLFVHPLVFISRGPREKKTHKLRPGERREDEIFIK
jgi:hypothetical protein